MKKKVLLIALLAIGIAAFAVYRFLYKEHRDIGSETTSYVLTAHNLKAEFTKNDSVANAKYADKTIEIDGKITAVDAVAHSIVIDTLLSAVLKDSLDVTNLLQKSVKIKGRFIGYDDLLGELKMDEVTIIN